ncbi:hypothetical protein C8R45DRAFT_1223974 [Mycena sanguinolenta]|nr:hypothetical protein C8R45DRAFT_1223974 [Mycena sanguinolenta]
MSSPAATFCNVPVSAEFDGRTTCSYVSRNWLITSGLTRDGSRVSGVLSLPCNVGVISVRLNNVPVSSSAASDLVLGLDWFNFVRNSVASNSFGFCIFLFIHDSGLCSCLDVRRHGRGYFVLLTSVLGQTWCICRPLIDAPYARH